MTLENELEMAKRRVAEAQRVVGLQERLIADLKAQGQDARIAEQTLKLLQRSLEVFEASYERLLEEQARMPRPWTLDTP